MKIRIINTRDIRTGVIRAEIPLPRKSIYNIPIKYAGRDVRRVARANPRKSDAVIPDFSEGFISFVRKNNPEKRKAHVREYSLVILKQ